MENIIISKSFKSQPRRLKEIDNSFVYDYHLGFWVLPSTDKSYMLSNSFHKPMTKKHDIETGEDRKGE